MCFRKPVPILPVAKRALFFAINDYPGSQNDLNGCVNDQSDFSARLNKDFPGFEILAFKNSQVTVNNFKSYLLKSVQVLRPGDLLSCFYSGHGTQINDTSGDEENKYDEAIYTVDGPVIDDEIREILDQIPAGAKVILFFDSCYSGTITKDISHCDKKVKFMRLPGSYIATEPIRKMTGDERNFVVFSGCMETETSCDAFIGGRYNGAFTYYALKTLKAGMTYRQWIEAINNYLPSGDFDQTPTLEGDESLFDSVVFS